MPNNADDRVTCGEMRAGDRCESAANAWTEAGRGTLAVAVVPAAAGLLFLNRKPTLESKPLPTQRVIKRTAPVACGGGSSSLEGLSVLADVPGAGKWGDRVNRDGTLRIEINERVQLPDHAEVAVTVESGPASLAGLVAPGISLGALTLSSPVARSRVAARSVARR